ncbi:MAG: hypothetical protein JW891_00450 [Candidatus Lokiarchaeota archaeon]|nr:hypothetical protein [Candidatus Lokiarchaeota archaeon]
MGLIKFEMETIQLKQLEGGISSIKLPDLTEQEQEILDPIVAPTSGLRIQIYEIKDENNYLLTKNNLFLFLRFFRAISHKYKELNTEQNLKILIVTDDRPSNEPLLRYCSAIFSYEGFQIYHQKGDKNTSLLSSPYGAASVALYDDIDLIIVITASHNDLSWNGIKFYIQYPMPMSGDLLKEISKKSLGYKEIFLNMDFQPILLDAEKKNNDYVIELLSRVLPIENIKGNNIVIWPYLGKANGIVRLFEYYGANVALIDEEINPPNPIKVVKEDKLKRIMNESNSNIALLLDADRDRIAIYVKQGDEFISYIPNEIYTAMHNILINEYNKKIINVRTIPSDLRSDKSAFLNLLTGVGYKHLGAILYFLTGVDVEKSKIDTAILYMLVQNQQLIKLDRPEPLKEHLLKLMEQAGSSREEFVIVLWEESGGHTIALLEVNKENNSNDASFNSPFPLIADKYPVPALVLITELVCRGHKISDSIDMSIVGINSTIPASNAQKIKIMKDFEVNDGKIIEINGKKYEISALSDNNNMIDIYQLKSNVSILYFRPSGTGPEVRFYIFGKRETYSKEIEGVKEFVKNNYA